MSGTCTLCLQQPPGARPTPQKRENPTKQAKLRLGGGGANRTFDGGANWTLGVSKMGAQIGPAGIYTHICAVKLKIGPRFGGFKVENWSKLKAKNWSKFFTVFQFL